MFTKRHYVELARIFRELSHTRPIAAAVAAAAFAVELAKTNEAFDKEKFLAACESEA